MSPGSGTSSRMPDFVEQRMTQIAYGSWDSIRKQGRPYDRFYYLSQAVVGEFRMLSNSKRVLVNKYENGSLLGLAELRDERKAVANLVSLTGGVIYGGDRSDLDYFREHHPDEFENWVRSTHSTPDGLYQKIDQLLSLELQQRLAIELLEFADCLGKRVGRGIKINTRLSRNRLSDVLGCAHESVSRILSQWASEGLIKTTQKIITILNPVKMAKHAPDSFKLPQFDGLKMAK